MLTKNAGNEETLGMSVDSPKVTVLISTYNRPDYLREAVESVVNQKMSDWELLVMNDGGLDAAPVIESFGDPRIRYFDDTENRGAAYRFNFGLKHARGRYVTYLGDDDLFYPNHLEVLSQALDDHPGIALAYSDLYAVSCVKDEATGRRFVLDKSIKVSRDFNRDFMFYYNHVLHVSLMHRIEAAEKVGGFDENVKVLIEWSLNRRLCFYFDFLHVPIPTGEYYMPLFKSDRISVVQRKDKESYRHNIRKIRTNLPSDPWTKVIKVDVIYPVTRWDDSVLQRVGEVIDHFDHPVRIILVNNGTGLSETACWAALGKFSDYRNISILTTRNQVEDLFAYRMAAKYSDAEFLYLLSDNAKLSQVSKRIFAGMEVIQNDADINAVKWDIKEEKASPFDILVDKKFFIRTSNPRKGLKPFKATTMQNTAPEAFKFDLMYMEAKRLMGKGEYPQAYIIIKKILDLKDRAPGLQFMIGALIKVCLALKKYDEAEAALRSLIEQGYEPDNWVQLGKILQEKKQFREAIEAYQNGLDQLHFSEADLNYGVFPVKFPKELDSFTALIGLAECHDALRDKAESSRYYHRASMLRSNSPKPWLGIANHFMAANQLDEVEKVLRQMAVNNSSKDPEVQRVMGKYCYKKGDLDLAFSCYIKAMEYGKDDEANIDPLYSVGANLGKWEQMKTVFENFLEGSPYSIKAMARLSSVYYHLQQFDEALAITRKGLDIEPNNIVLKGNGRKAAAALEKMSETAPLSFGSDLVEAVPL